jgi:hypothetical protein
VSSLTLTQENYYQDTEYMSFSRFKAFMQCEAKTMAILKGEYIEDRDIKPLLVGNYVHSYFESSEAHELFKQENASLMLTKKGELKADYKQADLVIDSLINDEVFCKMYHGQLIHDVEKEMIITGEINGVKFKGKVDTINFSKHYFMDLKTLKSIRALEWNKELKHKVPTAINNILTYQYHAQLAVYQELLKQMTNINFTPLIVAVSKEKTPDKEIISIDNELLSEGLEFVLENIKHIDDVKNELTEPKKCGRCDYCKSKKKLTKIISLTELMEEVANDK